MKLKTFRALGLVLFVFSGSFLAAQTSAELVLDQARSLLGTPYVYAGTSTAGLDCSGFVYRVYTDSLNLQLPRSTIPQSQIGVGVSRSDLRAGDLVFFNTVGNRISHVGIYDGQGGVYHAASEGPQIGVIRSLLTERYYDSRYVTARRILETPVVAVSLRPVHEPESESALVVPPPPMVVPTVQEAVNTWNPFSGTWRGDRGLREVVLNAGGTGYVVMANDGQTRMAVRLEPGQTPEEIWVVQDEPNRPEFYTSLVSESIARQLAEVARPMAWFLTLESRGRELRGVKETTSYRMFANSITSVDNTYTRNAVWRRR